MKKMIFGGLLFVVGALGVIAMIAVSVGDSFGSWNSNSITIEGWFAIILTMRALAPFIIFGVMGATGLALFTFETFRKKQ